MRLRARPSDDLTVDDALGAALADMVRRTGAAIGGVYLVEEPAGMLRLVAVCGVPVGFTVPWQRLPLTAPVPVADAIREDRVVWVGSQDEMARRYPRAATVLPYPFALAAAPLRGVHRHWGGIVLMWPADHAARATTRERHHIIASARRLARLLDDSPVPPAVPDRPHVVPVDAQRHPAQTALAAVDFLDRLPDGALALDLEGRVTFMSAPAARLLGRDADRLLGTRPWQSLPWLDDLRYEERYRLAVISRAPVSFSALRPPDQWLTFHLHPDASGISVRIIAGEETAEAAGTGRVGAVPSGRAEPAPTTPGRLYQLVHLAAALTETVTTRDLVALMADQILPAFGAQGFVLSIAEAGRLRIAGHHGYPADAVERLDALHLDTCVTPAGQVLASGVPAFFGSPAELAHSYPRAPRISGKQAWAFLPLLISGRPVGCCVLSYERPHAFTADERAVLTPLAGLLAQALDRAHLYDTQHHLVHQLQQALLPRSLPSVPGLTVATRYLPAGHGTDVGGDFYDLLRLDDTCAAAVIGDVEGHSMAAAALMGQVRTAIHAHATAGAAPDQVIARTNRLLADLASDLLVTCLYVHLDLARQELTLAGAGHVPPLLRPAAGRAHPLHLDPGPPLGVDACARYPLTRGPLPAGAVLALYTDGLVERPGTDVGHATAGLAEHLARAEVGDLERLVDGLVRQAWPTGGHTDDLTVLLLRTGGPHVGTGTP
ncbi:MAG: SpoIIE family protein phosphatase [Streptomyces sp.]|uniref:SpoIIE family protein phosphatase n=1 Tax=Streptomyces sp. TaxID=1931 RepID=UPI0025E8751F|nr:SpoIIE family protein phosphatase [Streptomyces sp.]MBW8800233.1 SpoIIE family protein phosphatase [Streptomyces sp.]